MADFDATLTLAGDDLGSSGEKEWQRLRQQLELADGFWLGFVFVASPRQAAALRSRTTQLLRMRARTTKIITPESPDELGSLLSAIFAKDSSEAGCVWVECVRSDSPPADGAAAPWTSAWDNLLLRANERREAIGRHLSGGLVFAAPPEIKPRVRNAAPDLWSLRSLVLEVAATPIQRPAIDHFPELRGERSASIETGARAPDPEFALAEAERRAAHEHADPRSVAVALLRAVDGLLAEDRYREAVEVARRAVNQLQGQASKAPGLYADALSALSRAEEADNDLVAALAHLADEIAMRRQLLAVDSDARLRRLRDLSLALVRLGDIRQQAGDLAEARAAYDESLQVRRRLVAAYGESPQALRDLSISLNKVGDVRKEAGDLAEARAAYDESLQLGRRLVAAYGESPQTLRDLSVSLDRVGNMRRLTGDKEGAKALFEEALQLGRRRLATYGNTPQASRDILISLRKVAAIRRETGDEAGANAADEEWRKMQAQSQPQERSP